MTMNRRRFNIRTAGLFAAATLPSAPHAQSAWPAKPVTCVVGYAPGGGVDFVMRSIAPGLSTRLGQPVIVDNKPGASGIIAARFVASAPADGYTIFGSDGGALVLNSALYATLPYDAARDFVPVTLVIRVPILIAVHPGVPANDLRGLAELSKRTPLSYASAGKGSYHHLGMEIIKRRVGFEAQDIAYKGAGPAALDVISGQVPVLPLDAIVALPHVRAGKLKVLAALSPTRLAGLPDVATAAEQGFADAETYAWIGIAAPRGTPRDIVMRLSSDVRQVVRTPEMSKRFTDLGMEAVVSSPDDFGGFLATETRRWHPLIKTLGLKLD
jgi:tripartite-type tricarboxylate transporter receptor subunit TctC